MNQGPNVKCHIEMLSSIASGYRREMTDSSDGAAHLSARNVETIDPYNRIYPEAATSLT